MWWDAIGIAFDTVFGWPGIVYATAGTIVGMIVGIIPGLGGASTIALLLPFTFPMSPALAMTFLLPIAGSSTFAGSLSAILLNMPGESVNAATTLDGFPLAQQGRAGEAIGASATASALGALFGLVILVIALPLLRPFILLFGPAEFFALAVMGLVLIATVSAGATINGLIAGAIGMFIGMIGYNVVVGGSRFTFDIPELWEGFKLIPTLIGVFAVAETIRLLVRRTSVAGTHIVAKGGTVKGIMSIFNNLGVFVRSSAIGTFIGVIPGVGGAVACWVGYAQAAKSAKPPRMFGKGDIRGVIGPEAANDAKDGGALIPTLILGIPGSATMAVLLGGFLVHGIIPGRGMMEENLHITWIIILALVYSNVMTSVIGVAFANQLVKVTYVPIELLAPFTIALAFTGAFIGQGSIIGLLIAAGMGVLGYIMVRCNLPRAPLVIGLMLAPIAERGFHQALQISRGTYSIFYQRPITLIFLLIALLSVMSPVLGPAMKRVIGYGKTDSGSPTQVNGEGRAK